MEPIFVEVQRFRYWALWLLMLAVVVLMVQVFRMLGHGPAWPLAAIGVVIAIGVAALLTFASLRVEVRSDGVYARFAPFHRVPRCIPFAEIADHRAVTYRPILDYGGWGVRGLGRDRAFTVSGDRGVKLTLRDGGTLLLGSQRADELAAAITRARG